MVTDRGTHRVRRDPADLFGVSLALSGPTLVVGAPGDAACGNSAQGAAYVYTGTHSTWSQTAQLTASDGAPGDSFGAVALSDTTIVVGAFNHAVDGNPSQGAAYVFGPALVPPQFHQ